MINTQYITLNMIPSGVLPVLHCSQYDVGRPLGMVVYNGGEAVDLDTYTCTIEATRTDGIAITAAVTTSGNVGAFATTATMTNKMDKYPAKLVLFDSNSRRVASLAFVMCVTPATMDENAESIEEDESLYQQYTGTVQALIADINTHIADMLFDTCVEMKASTTLETGMLCQTAGYHAVNDAGGALYRIYNTVPASHYETLANGLYAMLILRDHVTPQMYGATGDGVTDDVTAFNNALSSGKTVFVPRANYYLSSIIYTDDSQVIEDNGIYTDKALIISKKIKNGGISVKTEKIIRITESSIINNGRVMQASCYDSTNDRVVVAFAAADTDPATLVAYDTSFETILLTTEVSATSHFNDLTYNPNTHKIYTPARPTEDSVYIINPDTLTVERSITVDFGGIIKRFSYDTDNDIYYASGDDYIKIYDSEFNEIESYSIDFDVADLEDETGVPQANIILQSSLVVNGQFLMLWNESEGTTFQNVWITQFDYANKTTKQNITFRSVTGFDEAESIFVINDLLYILSSQGRKCYLCSFPLQNIDQATAAGDREIEIESGTDVNILDTPGVYVCGANNDAQSLINCPATNAFRLYVLKNSTGNYLIQIYTTIIGDFYLRYYRHDTGLWYNTASFERNVNIKSTLTPATNVSVNYVFRSLNGNLVTLAGRMCVRGDLANKGSNSVILSGFNIPNPTVNGVVTFIGVDNNTVGNGESAMYYFYIKENGDMINITPITANVDIRFTVTYMIPNATGV